MLKLHYRSETGFEKKRGWGVWGLFFFFLQFWQKWKVRRT